MKKWYRFCVLLSEITMVRNNSAFDSISTIIAITLEKRFGMIIFLHAMYHFLSSLYGGYKKSINLLMLPAPNRRIRSSLFATADNDDFIDSKSTS